MNPVPVLLPKVSVAPMTEALAEAETLLGKLATKHPRLVERFAADFASDVEWRWETTPAGFVYVARPGAKLSRWLDDVQTIAAEVSGS